MKAGSFAAFALMYGSVWSETGMPCISLPARWHPR
jgi:hypothetical protein